MKRPNPPTYSELLREIEIGNVRALVLNPYRREVRVEFTDGTTSLVPILRNDQLILRTAQVSGTSLTVKDGRSEEAMAGTFVNVGIIFFIVFVLIFLVRRSANIANRAIGFGRSQARIKPLEDIDIHFEDVAGLLEETEEVREIVTFLKQPENYTKLGARIPKGIILVGPPGTGKTLLAKAIAGEAGVPFFSISASEFVELFVGVGASRVRDLFAKAKQKSPCIIFIDEIDSIGRQRGAGIGGGNDEREQTLNQLLTEMDGFSDNSGVILLAATNRADILDSALTRPGRFDRRIQFYLPDRKARQAILSVHARTRPLSENVCLKEWAIRTPGFSGAELANLINEAAISTARDAQGTITDNHIQSALERVTLGSTSSPLLDTSKKRLIAYHEVGHALVAALTPHSDKVDKISILPRSGGMGGFTRFLPDEERIDSGLLTKNYLYSCLVVALGGRAAELLIFGPNEVTQGASGDLFHVGQIAREMVTKYGFSSLGPIALDSSQEQIFLGRDLISKKSEYSDLTGKAIDEEVRLLAKKALEQALLTLTPKREIMDLLVDALIQEETLESKRFLEIAGIS